MDFWRKPQSNPRRDLRSDSDWRRREAMAAEAKDRDSRASRGGSPGLFSAASGGSIRLSTAFTLGLLRLLIAGRSGPSPAPKTA